jgi:hypothetical protein
MASIAELQDALMNADRAGDTAAARALADEIYRIQSQGSKPQRKQSSVDQIPIAPGAERQMQADFESRPKRVEPGLGDKIKGVAETGLSLATGLTSGTLGFIGGAASGIADAARQGELGTEAGLRRAKKSADKGAEALTYAPRTESGREYTAKVGEAIQDSGIEGLPIGAEMAVVGRMASPAARQAVRAVADSPEAYMAGQIANKAKNVRLTPKIDSERAQLAAKAAEKGIEAPLHTLTDNKYLRMAGEFLADTPGSGSAKQQNNIAFQRQLIEQIGGNPKKFEKLTPTVFAEALSKSGKEIGRVFEKVAVPVADDALQADIQSLRRSLPRELDQVGSVIRGNIDELIRLGEENGGTIPGASLKKLHSEVAGKLRTGGVDNVPGLRNSLSDFQNILEDAAGRYMSEADAAAYQTARVQYAKAKTIEPLIARGGINGVSPQGLLQQMNSNSVGKHRMATNAAGELGDLAQIAQNFMKEQPSSGTAERSFAQNAVSSIGGAASAVAGVTAGNVYNRIARPLARRAVQNSVRDNAVPPVNFEPIPIGLAEESAWAPRAAATVQDEPYTGILTAEQARLTPEPLPAAESFSTRPDVPSIDFEPQMRADVPRYENGLDFITERPQIVRSGERVPQTEPQGLSAAYDNGIDYYGNAPEPAPAPVAENPLLLLEQPGDRSPPIPDLQPLVPDYPSAQVPFQSQLELLNQPEVAAITQSYRQEAARLGAMANIPDPALKAEAFRELTQLREAFAAEMRQRGIRDVGQSIRLDAPVEEAGGFRVQKTYDARRQVNAERQRLQLQRIGSARTVDEAIQAAAGE